MTALLRLVLVCLASAVLTSTGEARQSSKGKKYALLIGVKEYNHAQLSPLAYTENDIDVLDEILRKRGSGFASVRALTVSRGKKDGRAMPTTANIRKALADFLADKGRHDTVVIALSGHGVQLEVPDPDDRLPSKTYSYFCPTDADFAKIRFATGRAPKLILMPELLRQLGTCGAGTKLILVDACRNDLKAESSTRNLDVRDMTIPEGVAALFSCKAGERAWETRKLGKGHGVFFWYVLEAMRGKARNKKDELTWRDLVGYVTDNVMDNVPVLIKDGARQTPHEAKNLPGNPVLLPRMPGPSRTAGIAGTWFGTWKNKLGEKGSSTLVLAEGPDGNLSGVWDKVKVTGRWLNKNTIKLTGKTDTRSYQLTGTVNENQIILKYVSERLNARGSYEGEAIFLRGKTAQDNERQRRR
jgi:hypothetical protein